MNMKVGLFFGSFNPIHIGHLAIANYIVEYTDIEQIWFVVSPHNPLKKKESLLNDIDRLEMAEMAIKGDERFYASDIEFRMPKPSYTIDTLTYLKEQNPRHQFAIIMGADGLPTFHKWKNPKEIIKQYTRYIYPRHNIHEEELKKHDNIRIIHAPKIEISSSFIRKAIKEEKDVRYFLPNNIYQHICRMGYYHPKL